METQICQLHNCDMKKRTNANGVWYSHQLADKTWCNGYEKPKVEYTKKFTQLPNGQVHEEAAVWPQEGAGRPQNGPTSEVNLKSDKGPTLVDIMDSLSRLHVKVSKILMEIDNS